MVKTSLIFENLRTLIAHRKMETLVTSAGLLSEALRSFYVWNPRVRESRLFRVRFVCAAEAKRAASSTSREVTARLQRGNRDHQPLNFGWEVPIGYKEVTGFF